MKILPATYPHKRFLATPKEGMITATTPEYPVIGSSGLVVGSMT
jgi:hypothetical protein